MCFLLRNQIRKFVKNKFVKSVPKSIKSVKTGKIDLKIYIITNGSEVGGAWTQVNPNREVSRVIGARLAVGMAMRTKIIRMPRLWPALWPSWPSWLWPSWPLCHGDVTLWPSWRSQRRVYYTKKFSWRFAREFTTQKKISPRFARVYYTKKLLSDFV